MTINKTDLDELTARRDLELEEYLAVHVMGWEKVRIGYVGVEGSKLDGWGESPRQHELANWIDRMEIESVDDYFIDVQNDDWIVCGQWAPTIDLNDAQEVFMKLQSLGWWCKMTTPFTLDPGYLRYGAGFTPHGITGWNGRPDFYAAEETLELAICTAAKELAEHGFDWMVDKRELLKNEDEPERI